MKILVINIGGTQVKVWAAGHKKIVEIPCGPKMTPAKMVAAVRDATVDWNYDAVTYAAAFSSSTPEKPAAKRSRPRPIK